MTTVANRKHCNDTDDSNASRSTRGGRVYRAPAEDRARADDAALRWRGIMPLSTRDSAIYR